MNDEQFKTKLKQDLQAHFEQIFGPVTLQYAQLVPQGNEMAEVDVTVFKDDHALGRFYPLVGYVEGRLTPKWINVLS